MHNKKPGVKELRALAPTQGPDPLPLHGTGPLCGFWQSSFSGADPEASHIHVHSLTPSAMEETSFLEWANKSISLLFCVALRMLPVWNSRSVLSRGSCRINSREGWYPVRDDQKNTWKREKNKKGIQVLFSFSSKENMCLPLSQPGMAFFSQHMVFISLIQHIKLEWACPPNCTVSPSPSLWPKPFNPYADAIRSAELIKLTRGLGFGLTHV